MQDSKCKYKYSLKINLKFILALNIYAIKNVYEFTNDYL